MGTKSGELREMLLSTIDKVLDGTVKPDQATAIAKLAQQINVSVQVEVNAQIDQFKWSGSEQKRLPQLGHMVLGEDENEKVVSEQ